MFSISENKHFDYFIMACIALNALIMSMRFVGISDELLFALKILNYIFTTIFFIEMVIRLSAYGKNYFKDNWYIFDFTIVIGSIVLIFVSLFLEKDITTFVMAARLLRIGRLFRLFRKLKSLQDIFETFMTTLPHMFNVGAILLLILYIYSVIGINLFANIKPNGPMHKFLNFTSFYKSFITLIRIATGENWNELMNSLSMSNSDVYTCIEDPTYDDFVAADYTP